MPGQDLYVDEWPASAFISLLIFFVIAGILLGTLVTLKQMNGWNPTSPAVIIDSSSDSVTSGGRYVHYAVQAREAALKQNAQGWRMATRTEAQSIEIGGMFSFVHAGHTYVLSTGTLEAGRLELPSKTMDFGQLINSSLNFLLPTSNGDILSGTLDIDHLQVTLEDTRQVIPVSPLAHALLPGVDPTLPMSACDSGPAANLLEWNPSYRYNFNSLTIVRNRGTLVSQGASIFVNGGAIASLSLMEMVVHMTITCPKITQSGTQIARFTASGNIQDDFAFTLTPCSPVTVGSPAITVSVGPISGVFDALTHNIILTMPEFGNGDVSAAGNQIILRDTGLSDIFMSTSI